MSTDQLLDPVLPEANMHLVLPTQPVIGRVVFNQQCMRGKSASFVRHVAIDIGGTPLEGKFRAGQAFGVIPTGQTSAGKPHKVRLYSIASPTAGECGAGKVLSTTCKRLIDEYAPQSPRDDPDRSGLHLGVCSNYLCDMSEGTEVLVSGPAGKRFLLPVETDRHDYLFLATGTGIAPYRGMLKDLFEGPDGPTKSQVHLVMGVAYTTDLLYDDFLRELSTKHDNFHYHTVISREITPDGVRGGYVHHYLDRQLDQHAKFLASDRTLIYICGLAGMQLGVFELLAKRGLGAPYLKVKDELADIPPTEWDTKGIKRYVRPTHRCMLEVY